jgi:hypothetical protein
MMFFSTAAPIPPMRYTDSKYEDEFGLQDSANILSVNIVSSDVGFPVNVYGSVIARDSIDYKCIYLFQHNRDDCQPIKLKVHSCLKVCSNWFLFYSAVHLILTVIYGHMGHLNGVIVEFRVVY